MPDMRPLIPSPRSSTTGTLGTEIPSRSAAGSRRCIYPEMAQAVDQDDRLEHIEEVSDPAGLEGSGRLKPGPQEGSPGSSRLASRGSARAVAGGSAFCLDCRPDGLRRVGTDGH